MMNEASLLLLCVFSIDRFIAVTFPLQRISLFTTTRFSVSCVVSWVIPIFTASYPIVKAGHYYYSDLVGFYIVDVPPTTPLEEKVSIIISNILVLVPFSITTIMCLAVVVKLIKCQRGVPGIWWAGPQPIYSETQITSGETKMDIIEMIPESAGRRPSERDIGKTPSAAPNPSPSAQQMAAKRRQKRENYETVRRRMNRRPSRNTHIVVMMIGFYIVCLLPGHVLNLYNMLDMLQALPHSSSLLFLAQDPGKLSIYLYLSLGFSTFLFALNSCLNPFLYYLRSNRLNCTAMKRNLGKVMIFKTYTSSGFKG